MPADPPSDWVCRHAAAIQTGGRVLDLACGWGRHARWLCAAGFRVLAVDCDADVLNGLREHAIETRCLDLEASAWPLVGESFDGIVVTRYLHRPRWPHLVAALAPGGVLIYETFMQGQEALGRPSRAEFLLQPGELLARAADAGLEVLASNEGYQATPRPAFLQSICARRPFGSDGA